MRCVRASFPCSSPSAFLLPARCQIGAASAIIDLRMIPRVLRLSPPAISISPRRNGVLHHHAAALPAPILKSLERGRDPGIARQVPRTSTMASSIPMQAPDARCGVVACTASPIRTTRSLDQGRGSRSAFERAVDDAGTGRSERLQSPSRQDAEGSEQHLQHLARTGWGRAGRSYGRSSVTNMYISSRDTGLTPTFTLSPIHIRVRTISGGRGMTARQTHWPM